MKLKYSEQGFLNSSESFTGLPGLTTDMIKLLLDISAMIVYKTTTENRKIMKKTMAVPFNCIIGTTPELIVVGISTSKANRHTSELRSLAKTYDNVDDVLYQLNEVSLAFFGNSLSSKIIFDKNNILMNKESLVDAINSEGFAIDYFLKSCDEEDNKSGIAIRDEIIKRTLLYLSELVKEDKSSMYINPIFKAQNFVVDEKMVFCALPFSEDKLELFQEMLKPKLEQKFGFQIIKANDIMSNRSILEDIWTYINKARLVIVDISQKNPNVFYELGICHVIGKPTIIICDEKSLKEDFGGNLPFDISAIRTIIYRTELTGPEKLINDLENVINSIISGKDVII